MKFKLANSKNAHWDSVRSILIESKIKFLIANKIEKFDWRYIGQ